MSFYSFVDDAPVSGLYAWGLVAFAVIAIFIIGFFIAAACGYMAGLIGSSNSPISGIGIVAIITVSVLLLLLTEQLISTPEGKKFAMALAIFITSGVVAVAAIANDNLQDLKTGYLVGATPKNQQIALLIGCGVGAMFIAINGLLTYGTKTLRISALAVGLGIYLPVDISMAIVVGSLLSWLISYRVKSKKLASSEENKVLAATNRRGVLMASGFIVGESLVGVLLAIMILVSLSLGFTDTPFAIDLYLLPLFGNTLPAFKNILGLLVFIAVCIVFYKKAFGKKY